MKPTDSNYRIRTLRWPVAALAAVLLAGCAGQAAAPGAGAPGDSSTAMPPSAGSPVSSAPLTNQSSPGTSPSNPGSAAPSGTPAGTPTTLAPGAVEPLRADVPRGPAGAPAAAGTALDILGSGLLDQLPANENAVLSPYSIYAVLAMADAGAKGDTAAQLAAALGGTAATQAGNVTAVDAAVTAALAAGKPPAGAPAGSNEARPVTVDVANSVWLSPSLPVQPTYLDALAKGFGVGMFQTDYAADPDAARKAINAWVAEHTNQLIPALIGQGVITKDTVMTLVNALYLSAPWDREFDKVPAVPFTTAAGAKVTVPGMNVTSSMSTAAGAGWTSVTIPYRGSGLAMTLVIPDAGAFARIRGQLPKVLAAATAAGTPGPVDLTVPPFKSSAHLSLKGAMQALGVKDLFDSSADLSGIAGKPGDLLAGDLIHQAVITVDDQGTEAAAATALTMVATGAIGGDIQKIDVDRPFLYSIHDTTTGAPLFLGQVTDPGA